MRVALLLAALVSILGLASCARAVKPRPGVPIDARPTPPQPPAASGSAPSETGAETPPKEPKSGDGNGATERKASIARVAADTTEAGRALRRCGNRVLLPDQESVFETTRSLLAQTRTALLRNEHWRAESLARKARQLAASLDCPG